MENTVAHLTRLGSHSAMRSLRDERGTALVEFALVLPVVLLLIFGILWFGRAFNYSTDQTHLANEAARFAAVNNNPGAPNQTLPQWINSQIDTTELQNGSSDVPQPATVAICFPNGSPPNVGDPVEVAITSQFKFIPILNLPGTITIKRTATMRLETLPTNYSAVGTC
jgi:Flp pilus assembly protein TadG